jgi:23S rRNA pseudouridine1911/1915/1917 synthase
VNEGFEYREAFGPLPEGTTLLDYLSGRYPHSSREEWRSRIESGRVLLDGAPARPEAPARRGGVLLWRRPPWEEPEAPRTFGVLYEDEDILAAAKPAGLPVLPGANYLQATLLHLVRRRRPPASPLHRLGRWTSGVVLFALHREAFSSLSRQWAARRVGKAYRALARGAPSKDEFTVSVPIGPVAHPRLGTVHAASPLGKPAESRVRVLERRVGAFLLDVIISTGRPHQIRIHLAAAGHPLLGDPLYAPGGVILDGSLALPGDPGYLLHARELSFRHPGDGRPMSIACEPPDALRPSGS